MSSDPLRSLPIVILFLCISFLGLWRWAAPDVTDVGGPDDDELSGGNPPLHDAGLAIPEQHVRDAMARIGFPDVEKFDLKLIQREKIAPGKNAFTIDLLSDSNGDGGRVKITASSVPDLGAGVHWYLKHVLRGSLSWDATGGSTIPRMGAGKVPGSRSLRAPDAGAPHGGAQQGAQQQHQQEEEDRSTAAPHFEVATALPLRYYLNPALSATRPRSGTGRDGRGSSTGCCSRASTCRWRRWGRSTSGTRCL
jgi:hypothetical protein